MKLAVVPYSPEVLRLHMESSILPLEICEQIIGMWAHAVTIQESDSNLRAEACGTLCACAITCFAWLPLSRTLLYSSVIISSTQAVAFLSIVNRNGHLADLVRVFVVFDKSQTSRRDVFGPSLLIPLRNLRSLSVHHALWSYHTQTDEDTYLNLDRTWIGWGRAQVNHGDHTLLRIHGHSAIQVLSLSGVVFTSGWEFLRLVSSFRQLQSLILGRTAFRRHWEKEDIERLENLLSCRDRPYSTITYLQIEGAHIRVRSFLSIFFC